MKPIKFRTAFPDNYPTILAGHAFNAWRLSKKSQFCIHADCEIGDHVGRKAKAWNVAHIETLRAMPVDLCTFDDAMLLVFMIETSGVDFEGVTEEDGFSRFSKPIGITDDMKSKMIKIINEWKAKIHEHE